LAEAIYLSLMYSFHTKFGVQSASCPFRAGNFFHGHSDRDVKLTSYSSLLTNLRMYGAVLPFPHIPSWHVMEDISFVLHVTGRF
jgi:hypothetical protein